MTATVTLLLVEDDALILQILEEELADAGFGIVAASGGAKAMEALNDTSNHIAGLVTDIRLGNGPSGWDVARRAREMAGPIPVVYMTADSADEWGVEGVPNSVLLQKPLAAARIVTAISESLNTLHEERRP